MNFLFISSLYPTHENLTPTKITFALHNIVKSWNQDKNTNILVIRPVFLYLREIFKKKIFFRHKIISIDNVKIIVYPIFKIPKIAYFYTPLFLFLDRYLDLINFKVDLIVAHYDKSLQIGYKYSRRRLLPLVSGLHITPDLKTNNSHAFNQRCGKIIDISSGIACRSNYIYNKINTWFPQYKEKSFIAYSGIEESLVANSVNAIQRMKNWKRKGSISIITVSSLIERKKIDTILHALAILNKKINQKIDWNLTVIGDGNERPYLEQLVEKLGITEHVFFKGELPRHKVIDKLKQSHIFILVSYLETFGLVYLEAMATGNIVIGSREEGIDGIIQHEKNGFLSPAGKVRPLTEILHKILYSQESQLERILINANKTISIYTDSKVAQNYLTRLKESLKRGNRGEKGTGNPVYKK